MIPSEQVRDFLRDQEILIVDPGKVLVAVISKALTELGADFEKISPASNFADARLVLERKKCSIVFSEYSIGDGFGMDLLQSQKTFYKEAADRIFILVTANSDESAVADAAEEEVDSFLLKPFSIQVLMDALKTVIARKLEPSTYDLTLRRGKAALEAGRFEEALETFNEAKALSERPALAFYYTGLALEKAERSDEALNEFEAGLSLNRLHYKCLIGKFEILERQKRFPEAYEVIQTLTEKFPISPQRIGKIFYMAVQTRNFVDIRRIYEYYKRLDRRPQELRNVVAAGLFVGGKYLLGQSDRTGAMELFEQALLVSSRNPKYFERIIEALIEHEAIDEAETVLALYPKEQRSDTEFRRLGFMLTCRTASDQEIINSGISLIKEGLQLPSVYFEVVGRLLNTGKANNRTAENLIFKAMEQFTDQKTAFSDLLKKISG